MSIESELNQNKIPSIITSTVTPTGEFDFTGNNIEFTEEFSVDGNVDNFVSFLIEEFIKAIENKFYVSLESPLI